MTTRLHPVAGMPSAGALITVGGVLTRVVTVTDYPAGFPHGGPVKADLPARAWVTRRGTRWSGIRPDGTPHHAPTAYAVPTLNTV